PVGEGDVGGLERRTPTVRRLDERLGAAGIPRARQRQCPLADRVETLGHPKDHLTGLLPGGRTGGSATAGPATSISSPGDLDSSARPPVGGTAGREVEPVGDQGRRSPDGRLADLDGLAADRPVAPPPAVGLRPRREPAAPPRRRRCSPPSARRPPCSRSRPVSTQRPPSAAARSAPGARARTTS